MGEGRGDGLFLGIFPVKQRVPSRSNPIPSRACPQAAPARTGLGHSIPSQNSSPVPIAVPFNRKCPDRTFVRRKSLQGQDYGRTPLSGPEGPNSATDSEPRQSPDSCPVPTLDFGPWTLDSLNSVPARSRSQPIPVPVPTNPVPIRSRPGRIRPLIARPAHRSRLPNAALEPLSIGYPILRSCDARAKARAGRAQSIVAEIKELTVVPIY
jgi:hypothetical protein